MSVAQGADGQAVGRFEGKGGATEEDTSGEEIRWRGTGAAAVAIGRLRSR
jgi:hypothetical protein